MRAQRPAREDGVVVCPRSALPVLDVLDAKSIGGILGLVSSQSGHLPPVAPAQMRRHERSVMGLQAKKNQPGTQAGFFAGRTGFIR
jgi:hypothetical protein